MILLTLAWRNLWRQARRTLITSSTIAFGLGLALVSVGLGDGAHNQMVRGGIRLGEGHLTVQRRGYLEAPANHVFLEDGTEVLRQVEAAGVPGRVAPRIFLQALISSANNALPGGLLGIDVADDPQVDALRPTLVEGAWLDVGDPRGLLIGRHMAERLKAKLGARIVVMAGVGGETESQLGRVRGIFSTGIDELDSFQVVASLAFGRRMLPARDGRQPLTRVAIFLEDDAQTPVWREKLAALPLPAEAQVLTWQEMLPQLVTFIAFDDAGNYIWLLFVLVMVTFGIINTILMSVLERTREFGMLRALGMKPARLLGLVLAETLLLAGVSIVEGWIIGGAGHWYLATYGLDLTSLSPDVLKTAGVMMDPLMKSELSPQRVAMLTGIVFGTTMVSGLYPALRASRVPPVRALQT